MKQAMQMIMSTVTQATMPTVMQKINSEIT